MLEIMGLTVRYGDLAAARDVGFTLPDGEIGCLLGPSGCGKTTVGKSVIRLFNPSGGSVQFRGEELVDLVEARDQAIELGAFGRGRAGRGVGAHAHTPPFSVRISPW